MKPWKKDDLCTLYTLISCFMFISSTLFYFSIVSFIIIISGKSGFTRLQCDCYICTCGKIIPVLCLWYLLLLIDDEGYIMQWWPEAVVPTYSPVRWALVRLHQLHHFFPTVLIWIDFKQDVIWHYFFFFQIYLIYIEYFKSIIILSLHLSHNYPLLYFCKHL